MIQTAIFALVLALTSFAQASSRITAGQYHSCSIRSSGDIFCWGANGSGQLGDGTTAVSEAPVEVVGVGGTGFLSNVTGIAAGLSHTCAIVSTGSVYCWGANNNGQLGNGATVAQKVPVQVKGVGGTGFLAGIVAIAAGEYHTCAADSSGKVYCWGANGSGQLGNGATTEEKTPVEVEGVGGTGFFSGAAAISAGWNYTCALMAGNVYCWGLNSSGQLGNGALTNQTTPVQVEGVSGTGFLSGVAAIAAGQGHTCAAGATGSAFCWGLNSSGQLGNGTLTNQTTPVQVEGIGGTGFLSGVSTIAAGQNHTCALNPTGSAFCWGSDASGQLGNINNSSSKTPIQVLGQGGTGFLSLLAGVAGGQSHTCAMDSSGDMFCWGSNVFGQLGIFSTSEVTIPTVACAATNTCSIFLTWNPSTSGGISGYNLYWGTVSGGPYPNKISAGNVTQYIATGFGAGIFYFVATAVNSSGVESAYSNQTVVTVTTMTDSVTRVQITSP